LSLVECHTLFLDEIIDGTFVNECNHLVFCSNSETLKLLDLNTGCCEFYAGHSDIVISLDKYQVKAEDGKIDESKAFILSGGKDSEVRLWRFDANAGILEKLKCLAVFRGHNQNICSVNFAPKRGKLFVSASQDSTIKVWDIKKFMGDADSTHSDNIEVVNQATMTVMAHRKYINVAKFSPNDKIIATASQDKSIKLWAAKDL